MALLLEIVIGVAALVVLSPCIIWPIGYVFRWFRNRPSQDSVGARLARLLAALVGTLVLLFAVGIVLSLLNIQVREFFFTMPPTILLGMVLGVPTLAASLSLGLPFLAALAWKNRYWSLWGRLHYSFLTLSAVLLSALMSLLLVQVTTGSDDSHLLPRTAGAVSNPLRLEATDPSRNGPYRVITFFYGSGSDKHRVEFQDRVAYKTLSVDASPFLENWVGKIADRKAKYWGFDTKHFPLNGRVWYPVGDGPFPLILIVHGNHYMKEFSDPGYAYLADVLASRGFIAVSVDQNFLNGQRYLDALWEEIDARAWMLLQHLSLWRRWNETPGHLLYRKVDMESIALIGHSRGGEAVATAAAFNKLSHSPDRANVPFDFNFSIRSVVALAPVDGEYLVAGRPVQLENVNYLVLQGSHDSDKQYFAGIRQYRRIKFNDGRAWFKSAVYIYRANHSRFNTAWGEMDSRPPFGWLLNQKPILAEEEQRQVARVFVSAFLEATLHGNRAYVPLFNDPRIVADWLPSTLYVKMYQDSNYKVLADYEEDIDLTTTSMPGGSITGEGLTFWKEQGLAFRDKQRSPQGNNAVILGWDAGHAAGPASYCIARPESGNESLRLDARSKVTFSFSTIGSRDTPLDVTIELFTRHGLVAALPLAQFGPMFPPLRTKLYKLDSLETRNLSNSSEIVLQGYSLPLAHFIEANPNFEPVSLQKICFRLDGGPTGLVVVDDVGFALE